MARHKDVDWNLPTKLTDWDQVNTAILMDIRDELKAIRALQERTIGCWRFAEMPHTLKRMDKRLAKKFGPLNFKKRKK